MLLTKFIVDIKRVGGDISSQVAIALGEHISKIVSNKKRLANQILFIFAILIRGPQDKIG